MKKIIFCLFCTLSFTLLTAQNYKFPIDQKGACIVTKTITNNNDAATNFAKVKNWINNQKFKNISVNQENTGISLNYTITKNTKNTYNPFAGVFSEDLIFSFEVMVEGNMVTYTFQNFQIQETYAGYGNNNKITPLEAMISKVQNAEKEVADAVASGDKKKAKKLRKENEDIIEDGNETLENAYSIFVILQNNLDTQLK